MTDQRSRQSIPKHVRDRPRRPAIGKQVQAVFDSLPAHIAVLDATGTILAVNAAWRHFAESNGYASADHGVGLNYLDICRQASAFADARAAERAILAVIAREQAEYCYEYACHSPDQQHWFLFRAARFVGSGPISVIVSHEQITHYKQIEDRARWPETTYRRMSKRAEDLLHDRAKRLDILHEIDRAIISASSIEAIAQAALHAMYRLIPSRRGSVVLFDFESREIQIVAVCVDGEASPDSPQRFPIAEIAESETVFETLRRGETCVVDLRDFASRRPVAAALVADGICYQICAPLIAQGELLGALQFCTSTPETFGPEYMPIIGEMLDSLAIGMQQTRLFEQVRAGREQLQELSRRLVAAQELERRQIASDLHDQIGQNLAVLNMNLTNVRNQLSYESAPRLDRRLAEAIQIVEQTIEQIRNVMAELRPAILDDFGLVAALRWYTRHFARHTDLVVLLEVEEPRSAPRLPSDLETALFRISQEALTNVIKHARATLATLKLTIVDHTIRLAISDDGVGFNFGAKRRPKKRSSLGLMTMQERVEAVGGRLVIDSAPGQGTRIIAEVARKNYADRDLPR